MGSITDSSGNVVAVLDVTEYASHKYMGTIISSNFPEELSVLFKEFQELAESQAFSLLDEISAKIRDYGLTFTLTDTKIYDLQVIDGDQISFRI